MVDLCRSGRDAHLHVLFCTQLQVTFQTRRGVLWALAFVTVRQQHHQATHTAPFLLTGADELVDHYLSTVGKVTKLRFPDGQGARLCGGVAIFKCQNGFFRQHRVPDFEFALAAVDIRQRDIDRTIFLVVHHRMTVEEGATASIFTGNTDRDAFISHGGVSQRFRCAPVERFVACGHLGTITVDFRDARLHAGASSQLCLGTLRPTHGSGMATR
ncbi:hypothetical protein D3C77_461910 [compost metagenome]